MLERIDAVWVGTDAPGPQPGLVLAALQQPTLRVATEEFAGVSVGWDHLGAKFAPVPDHLIADRVAQRAAQGRHQMKTQAPSLFGANAIGTHRPPVAVKQSGRRGQVVAHGDVGIVKGRERARDGRVSQLRLAPEEFLDHRGPVDRRTQRLEERRIVLPWRRLAGYRVWIGLVEGDLLV